MAHRARAASGLILIGLFLLLAVPLAGASTPPASPWRDVKQGTRPWFAHHAIDYVGATNNWMRDYGKYSFHPVATETRRQLARAVVRAFAPTQQPASGMHIKDVASDDPFYPYVNVAVTNGWMSATDGTFDPTAPVDEYTVSRAVVFALGLRADVKGANGIHLHDGTALRHPGHFGVLLVGRAIGLWYNHDTTVRGDSEAFDILPTTSVPRDDVAYALAQAAHLGSSAHWYADQYAKLDVGSPSRAVQKVIEFGMRYVGYPYVYAGEWDTPTGAGYCCGTQLQGGFDCSGLTWWLLRAGDSVWNNQSIRGYRGWILNERSSMEMAGAITKRQRIPFAKLRPGDIMLYGSSPKPATIYHVDTYIGGGWSLDSGDNGVTILKSSTGWYRQTFQYGRRLKPAS
jgi:cell wall-associated NlpC family hydrolase